eukprot:TRINITY_DN41238_c0_g1_i1.p1 TRINITY_DN41238_c0_g1~~TRINITY_DN41238_c0_g1_i1.p1  ORF type:complete len:199 (+),score=17.56 TRINITY_DN41238_c0_g1_i1:63-659(+)
MNPKLLVVNVLVSLLLESLAYRLRVDKTTTMSVGDDDELKSTFVGKPYECGGAGFVITVPSTVPQRDNFLYGSWNALHYTLKQCMVACHHIAGCGGFSFFNGVNFGDTMCILKTQDCENDKSRYCDIGETTLGKCSAGWTFWSKHEVASTSSQLDGCAAFYVTFAGETKTECTRLTAGYPGKLGPCAPAPDSCRNVPL